MPNEINYGQEDKVRALSPQDLARILILAFGSTDISGIKLLGKKTDGTYEVIKSDDEGRILVKSATADPVYNSTTAAWQTAEADVVSIGAANTKYLVHSLLLSIHNLVGTTITVRLYMKVNGTERKVYQQTFDASSDPPGLWIVDGTVGIHEALRVTLQSNNAADNGKAVDYDYMLEGA